MQVIGQPAAAHIVEIEQLVALGIPALPRARGQIHGNARRRAHIGHRVHAGAASQRVGSRAADHGIVAVLGEEGVVARAADEDVRSGIPLQEVAESGARQVLDLGRLSPPLAMPVARSTVTPAVDTEYSAVSVPEPPYNVSTPAPPSSTSSPAPP